MEGKVSMLVSQAYIYKHESILVGSELTEPLSKTSRTSVEKNRKADMPQGVVEPFSCVKIVDSVSTKFLFLACAEILLTSTFKLYPFYIHVFC